MTLTHDGPVTDPAGFRPQGQDDLAPSGAASRVAANLAALRALRVLQAEGRPATPDEQAVLARWSGWGAVPQVFDDDRGEFAAARAELHQLLPEPHYAAARRTTINAHYTDAALARVVWDAVAALGFDGGQVLEPGCGSGNFIVRPLRKQLCWSSPTRRIRWLMRSENWATRVFSAPGHFSTACDFAFTWRASWGSTRPASTRW